MDENYHNSDASPEPVQPGRRRLLKALGAAGGGLVAGMVIPAHWTTPTVEAGYLPAHAQVSGQITLADMTRTVVRPLETCTSDGNTGNRYQIRFDYDSPFGDVEPGTVVTQSYVFANSTSGSFEIVLDASEISGDGFQGTISYTFCSAFGPPENNSVTTTVRLRTPAGRTSTAVSVTASRPPGALDQPGDGGSGESL